LLQAADPPAMRVLNREGRADLLILCDHAAAAVPAALAGLGLDQSQLTRHIGWDIGAAEVAVALAEAFGAPAVLSAYSRLVIDCNRDPTDPTSIPPVSDGVVVPGNQALSAPERLARAEACFWPYHRAIAAQLERAAAAGIVPAALSIHSFTPVMAGIARPWQIGILWDRDPRLPQPLLARLRALPGLTIGENEPYSGRDAEGFTLRHHAVPRGLPHVLIELRQDEIGTADGVRHYVQLLEKVLRPILAEPGLYRAETRR
jgi:predicted N-formylglutamate amidohydrolase